MTKTKHLQRTASLHPTPLHTQHDQERCNRVPYAARGSTTVRAVYHSNGMDLLALPYMLYVTKAVWTWRTPRRATIVAYSNAVVGCYLGANSGRISPRRRTVPTKQATFQPESFCGHMTILECTACASTARRSAARGIPAQYSAWHASSHRKD